MIGRSVLITGASGTVGSALLKELIETGLYKIAVTVSSDFIENELLNSKVCYIDYMGSNFKKDIINFSPDSVIHLASFSTSNDDISNIRKLVDSNIIFISILLDALKETNVRLFLNTGSFSEYSSGDGILNPAYFYAATKTASRAILSYYKNLIKMKTCTIIPYTIYGSNNKSKKVFDYILESLNSKVSIPMTKGDQILDFIHISDVVSFFSHILENEKLLVDNEDYHLGIGQGTSIKDLARIAEEVSGLKANISWGEMNFRNTDIMRAVAPVNNLQNHLGWAPKIGVKEGMLMSYHQKGL